ncbi:MAG: GldG family protein [Candidatus Muiribacteriota bacterium]
MNFKKMTQFNIILAIIFVAASILTYGLAGNILGWLPVIFTIVAAFLFILFIIFRTDILLASVKGKSLKFTTNAVIYALIVFAIIWALNFIVYNNNKEIDLTPGKRHTLAPQTVNVLQSLEKDVEVLGFFTNQERGLKNEFENLMERFRLHTRNVEYKSINPVENHSIATRYNVEKSGVIIFKCGENEIRKKDITESDFLNALTEVYYGGKQQIYFVRGHGEKRLTGDDEDAISTMTHLIRQDNYEINELELIRKTEIPDDAALIIVAGPEVAYAQSELNVLEDYINKGGKVIFMIDPEKEIFEDFISRFNIKAHNKVIIDLNPLGQYIGTNYIMPIVTNYHVHPVIEGFDLALVMKRALPLEVKSDEEETYNAEIIALTGEDSWGESNLESLKASQKVSYEEENDLEGPLGVVAVAEKEIKNDMIFDDSSEEENASIYSRVMVIGDSDFITNEIINMQGNGQFFLNCINYMTGFEDFIALRPREVVKELFQPTEREVTRLYYLYYLIIPLIPVLIYAVFFLIRKRGK